MTWCWSRISNNRIEVQDEKGHKSIRRSSHVKYIEPSEKIVQQLPSDQILEKYGRTSKLLLAAKDVPNLQFDISEIGEKGEPCELPEIMEIVDTTVNKSEVTFPNSDFREHSKKSSDSVAGETTGQKNHQGHVKTMVNLELQNKTSKYREHSQKLQISEETKAVQWS